ncbi:MAG: hypothetical protein AB7V13_03885 [Pseudorhodoplanes sp.]
MRNAVLAAMLSWLVVCGSAGASAALECPVKSVGTTAAQDQAIAAAIPAGDALDDVTGLNAAVASLRAKGIGNAILIDSLIASYCPAVARDAALSEAQKRARVSRFAGRIARVVYGLESADAVILDVPFRPDVMSQINAKAVAEKVSPQDWVANAIGRVLK